MNKHEKLCYKDTFVSEDCEMGNFPDGSVVTVLRSHSRGKGLIPGSGISLEEGMATHSSILAWRINPMARGA